MKTVIITNSYETVFQQLREQYYKLSADGSFFAVVETKYNDIGNVELDFMDVISEAIKIGYQYINTIVFPTLNKRKVAFVDNAKYAVWLCKDKQQISFEKDLIREKHIWKDVEWGKREKNYNPKGKDPGNVWIPTDDNGKGVIIRHHLLSEDEIISRLLKMTCSENDNSVIKGEQSEIAFLKINTTAAANKILSANVKGNIVFSTAENMKAIENNSAAVAVTSPPYWDLKDYYKKGQIGQEPYDVYLNRMEKVWGQCYRKLSSCGSLWININIRSRAGKTILIPKDIIEQCKKIGFYYKGIVIWHKSSGIPTGAKNIVDRHEYVLIFAKNEHFSVSYEAFEKIEDYKNDCINGGSLWNINRKAGSVGKKYVHPAIYPNDLVKRIVLCTSSPGDMIIDPFLGSGTTLISALSLGRNCIGYEFNEGFKELIQSRIEKEIPELETNIKYTD